MACKVVGDGKSPNKFFVSVSPYYQVDIGDYQREAAVLEGFDAEADLFMFGPFKTLEEALDCFDDHDLCAEGGIGSVTIEDRETGTVKEKFLVAHEVKETRYRQEEF